MTTLDALGIKPKPDFKQLLKVLWRQGKPDFVPFYELFVNSPVMETILGKKLPDRKATVEFYYRAGYDYVPVWPNFPPMALGSLADRRQGYPISDRASFCAYAWPDLTKVAFSEFDSVAPILPQGMKMIGQTGGIFELAEQLCGYEQLCFLLSDDRALVNELFERIGILYEHIYSGMASRDTVAAVVISDDLGFKTQTLISPEDLREFVFPLYRKLVNIAHDHNKPCILHSCGNLAAIMDELIGDVRIDAKHSYENVILPATEARKLYGNRIAILGGYDVDKLCRDTELEIRQHVDFLIDTLGVNGGYALGSGNSIPEYVPIQNYLTMLDQGWKRR